MGYIKHTDQIRKESEVMIKKEIVSELEKWLIEEIKNTSSLDTESILPEMLRIYFEFSPLIIESTIKGE